MLYILKTIYNFKIKLSFNKDFGNTCMVLISKTPITDITTIAGINYKEQYECEWNSMILTNYIICSRIFKIL